MSKKDAKSLIQKLRLEAHPEGGFYKRTYQSTDIIDAPKRFNGKRYAGTAIYYLLEGKDFSAWHRLKSDELWHFYCGSSLQIYIINEKGDLESRILGNSLETENAEFQIAIHANQWFAAEVMDKTSFALIGCSVIPGFDFADWELGECHKLLALYPEHSGIIERFSRN